MRLLTTFSNRPDAEALSAFLASHKIKADIDEQVNNDWGSDHYSALEYRLWIIDEDDFPQAEHWLEQFLKERDNPVSRPKMDTIVSLATLEGPPPHIQAKQEEPPASRLPAMGYITTAIIAICIALFIVTEVTAPHFTKLPPNIPLGSLLSSQTQKVLMFDYPQTFSILDRFVNLYGITGLENPAALPAEGKFLLQKFYETPYWKGLYDQFVAFIRQVPNPWDFSAPMFEKIRDGQMWRLVSPCFLHADIWHILFNMLWLVLLGKQLEFRLGVVRYLVLIFLSAVISNTAQYLMSGPNFIGFSGVICAMIAFIWTRQKVAPWEGYQLQPMTRLFIAVFILAIVAIQLVFFVLQAMGVATISVGIANTAHLAGALIGFLLARSDAFSWKSAKA